MQILSVGSQFFFRIGISAGAFLVFFVLYLLRWKRVVFVRNRRHLAFEVSESHYAKALYLTCLDVVSFLAWHRGSVITIDDSSANLLGEAAADGGILFAMHFGNFELMCSEIIKRAPNFRGAYKPLANSWADRCLLMLRSRGMKYVDPRVNSPLGVKVFLREKGFFGLMVDQDHRKPNAVLSALGDRTLKCNPWLRVLSSDREHFYLPLLYRQSLFRWNLRILKIENKTYNIYTQIHEIYYEHLKQEDLNWKTWWHKRFKSVGLGY